MENPYKSALDKIKLSESEKDRAKALFHLVHEERGKNMRIKVFLKPAVIIAAGLALVLGANAVIPMLQGGYMGDSNNIVSSVAENYFTIKAYAKELTETGEVYSNEYASLGATICDFTTPKNVSFAFDFPIECEGENIDTITYAIQEGAFQISNPKGKSIVVDGEKVEKELNVPGSAHEDIAGKGSSGFEWEQYRSFTVKYNKQTDDKTCIDVVGTANEWSKEKINEYKKIKLDSPCWENIELCNFLTKDLGITCTVTYKDGSTEKKDILVSNKFAKPSEVMDEETEVPAEKDQEIVVKYFSIR